MAIQTQDLLYRMSPTAGLKPPGGGGGEGSERERLRLMREQFEETKKQNALDEQYRRDHEAGEMARAKLGMQREREQREAAAAAAAAQRQGVVDATALETRQKAHDAFLKYRDVGDYEGMEAAATQLNAVGGLAERLGEDENGLPSWRVEVDAEAARARDSQQAATAAEGPGDESIPQSLNRMSALGYDTLGTRGSPEDAGIGDAETRDRFQASIAARGGTPGARGPVGGDPTSDSTDELTSLEAGPPAPPTAGAAAPQAPEEQLVPGETKFNPLRQPGMPDLMGGVPKNVIDTGAMAAQTQRRLGPVMAEMAKAYPSTGGYRDSAEHSNAAALGLGLPAGKTLDAAKDMRSSADAAIRSEQSLAADAAKVKAAAEVKPLTSMQIQQQVERGFKRAERSFMNNDIKPALHSRKQVLMAESVLTDKDANNDEMSINFLMDLGGQKGPQSDADALRVTGLNLASLKKQLDQLWDQYTVGGLNEDTRTSMNNFIQMVKKKNEQEVYGWVKSVNSEALNHEDENVAKGYAEFLRTSASDEVMQDYYRAHPEEAEDEEEDAEEPPAPAAPAAPGQPRATPVSMPAAPRAARPPPPEDADFDGLIDSEAQAADINPQYARALIGGESGGKGDAANPKSSAKGIIQMIDSTARGYTNPRTGEPFKDAAEFAALPRNEQVPVAMDYFKSKGLDADSTPEEYALAIGAPAFLDGRKLSGDTVVYAKGTHEHDINRPWWPAGGGDITVDSMTAHYFGRGKKGAAKSEAPAKPAGKGRDDAMLDSLLE